jgi:hypothetical protein
MRAEKPAQSSRIPPYRIIGQAAKPARQPTVVEPPMSDLQLREAMYVRISLKRRRPQLTTPTVAPVRSSGSPPDANTLVSLAHDVLVRYRPGAALPNELAKVRALLEPHMFGRDGRVHRDDAVRIARQIDEILPA